MQTKVDLEFYPGVTFVTGETDTQNDDALTHVAKLTSLVHQSIILILRRLQMELLG